MFKSTALILGVALAAGATARPASAMVHQIGSVNVAADHYTDVSWSRFEGPVVRLRLIPDSDTVDCDHISITYRDGITRTVFSGTLVKDSVQTITFPGGDNRIANVDFACKAQSVDGARISLSSVSEENPWFDGRTPRVTTYESGEIVDR